MNRLMDQLGTLVIVTVVTMLVWLYAEDANVVEYTDQSLRLQFVLPEGTEGVLSQEGATVKVDFNSSNGQYQQFLEQTRGEVITIQLPVDLQQSFDVIPLDIRDQLEQSVFRNLGINLTSVNPERIEVTFDKIIDHTMEIRIVSEPGPIKLAAQEFINADDRLLTLRLPASQARALENKFAIARIPQSTIADQEKGVSRPIRVPIELPAGVPRQAALPADIEVLATVANDRATINIDRLTIQLAYPPSINKRYIVEIDEASRFLTAFELEGPREQIELIKADPGAALVRASVWLNNEEVDKAAAEGGELTKAVEIIAPPGVVPVTVAERVTIRVTPREAPATP